MLTKRTIASLSQFLALKSRSNVEVLLIKHDAPKPIGEWGRPYLEDGDIFDALSSAPSSAVEAVLTEVWRTINNLKRGVDRDRLEERLNDLYMCITLDGYVLNGDELVKTEPEFEGGAPEDDLTSEIEGLKPRGCE
jgi:hypothetical protein